MDADMVRGHGWIPVLQPPRARRRRSRLSRRPRRSRMASPSPRSTFRSSSS